MFWHNPFHRLHTKLNLILERITYNMATIEERFTTVETKLNEASTEIVTEIQRLRDELAAAQLTPAAEAILERLETKAGELADIVPNVEPPTP